MRLKTPICQTYERSTVAFRKLRNKRRRGELPRIPSSTSSTSWGQPCYWASSALRMELFEKGTSERCQEYTIPDILWSSSIWLESAFRVFLGRVFFFKVWPSSRSWSYSNRSVKLSRPAAIREEQTREEFDLRLCGLHGCLSRLLHPQLDLSILCGGLFRKVFSE